jgi:hypothetical protein
MCGLSNIKNEIVLIKEMENGMYDNKFIRTWRFICYQALKNNLQIFVSTCSYGCIKALVEAIMHKDIKISLFRFNKDKIVYYPKDILISSIKNNYDI